MKKIVGGFYLKARCSSESFIANAPPHVREIWDFILMRANYKESRTLKRGQLLTSYSDIIEALSWKVGYRKVVYKKHHCETAMKLLTKQQMVATERTARGMIITVLNYEVYQDPSMYENRSENDYELAMKLHENRTITKERKKEERKEKRLVHFEQFWTVWPRKENKAKAIEKWSSKKCDDHINAILSAVKKMSASEQWTRDQGRYIPLPTTWLNGERWKDEGVSSPATDVSRCASCDYWRRGMCRDRSDEQRIKCSAYTGVEK